MSNYVNMFLNELEEPLYIGISTRLVQRIETQHFKSKSGNLSKECLEETHKISYHIASSADDMKIKERYLINTLRPKYNNKMNNRNDFNYPIPVNWLNYDFDKKELLKGLKERTRSYQSGVIRIRNHRNKIIPIPYSWLPYGIYIDVDKNTFCTILEKGKKNVLFIVVQGEFYINDDKELSSSWGNYKTVSREHNLDRKKDFISIVTKKEIKRYERDIKLGKSETLEGISMAGKSFIRYDVVKKLNIYTDKKFSQFDENLKKITVI